jgi:Domain of unknown function (DUF1906)
MRRTAVAVIGFGCAIGVFAAAGTIPASASAAGRNDASSSVSGAGAPASATGGVPADHTRGTPSSQAKTVATSKLKTVEYDGYSVTVPYSWPVFHLDTDPGQCVRYDINAVYLGNPGTNQNCPSNLIGRAQTITIASAGVSPTPRALYQRAAVAHGGLGAALPASSVGQRIGSVPSTLSRLDQYSQEHEFQAAVSHSNVSVMGTYGSDPGQVETIIRGVQKADQPSGTGTPAGTPGSAPGSAPTTRVGKARQAAASTGTPDRTLPIKATSTPEPTPKPTATPSPTGTPKPTASPTPSPSSSLASSLKPRIPSPPLNGFDTCTAPSVSAMKAWKGSYSAIGVYIGGQNMACSYGNLSSSWVKSVHSMGWSLLPLYVGLQAPCNPFPGKINPSTAASQAKGAADAAVADAGNFGMGKGSPIYFDMESYNNSNGGCRAAVLTFLDAWTRELHARGYASGVYSSASTGVTDLVGTTTISGHSMAQPDAMWFALWDSNGNLTGTPYLPSSRWASDRVKQYAGNKTQKIGGYTINIDADRVGGAVAGP